MSGRPDIRWVTSAVAVAPQITVDDIPALQAAGVSTIICNRPDAEVTPDLQAAAIRAAAEAAGLAFVDNPVIGGALPAETVDRQSAAITEAPGAVLAYCRSGTRSCIVWAFGAARTRPVDEIVAAAAQAGYDLGPYRPMLEAMSQG